jgi:hypothetical protein
MNTIRIEIASAIEAYRKAEANGDLNELATASARLYEALGRPLGSGLTWVWVQFETWTTTN